jgi:hypothetical protein
VTRGLARSLALVGCTLLAAIGCSSSTYEAETGTSADAEGSPTDGPADLSTGAALSPADIECAMSAGGVAELEDVPCDELHDIERFELETDDLDSCMATIRASSDVVIVESDVFSSGYDIDDDRVSGHAFSGGMGSVSCSITLAQPQDSTLLGS